MYRVYAAEPAMRLNVGIRRRLARPPVQKRRTVGPPNRLLLPPARTPGLHDVRTPMQWNSDRNAGFSRSNPQRLILPVIIDPEYHFEAINVKAQQNNTHSL